MMVRLLLVFIFFFVAGLQSGKTSDNVQTASLGDGRLISHSTMMPQLRSAVVVEADLVTLGDLFDFAGLHAETPVFRAPPPGTRGALDTRSVERAAKAAGLTHFDTGALATVFVERAGTLMGASDFEALVLAELEAFRALRFGPGSGTYQVSFTSNVGTQMIGREKVVDLHVDFIQPPAQRTGAFVASVTTRHGQELQKLTGIANHVVQTQVLSRPIGRGEIISQNDLQTIELSYARSVSLPTLVAAADIVGKAAARSLRAGAPLAPNDVMEPHLVDRQEIVSLIYRHGSLALTVRARALDQGAAGQAIDVVNLQSNRTVRGVVTGRGVVQVLPPMEQVANAVPGVAQ